MFFSHQMPAEADFMQQCIHHATRMTAGHQTDSVSDSVRDQTTQDTDHCSIPTVTAAVPSISDSSGINWYKSTDMHIGLNAIDRQDCRGECTSMTLIAYCLAQYISTLDVQHRNHVQSQLSSDAISWISKLFR